jgi:DNA-binding phage protein
VFDERFLKKSISLKPTSFFQQHTTKQWQFLPNQLQWSTFKKKIVFQTLLSKMPSQHIQNIFTRKYLFQEPSKDSAQLKFYVHHIEGLSQQYFNTSSKWDPFKVNEYTKSAQFTAEYIANALELQKPVKQIFSTVQKCLKKTKMSKVLKLLVQGDYRALKWRKLKL